MARRARGTVSTVGGGGSCSRSGDRTVARSQRRAGMGHREPLSRAGKTEAQIRKPPAENNYALSLVLRKATRVSRAIVCEYRVTVPGLGPRDLRGRTTAKHARTSHREVGPEPNSHLRLLERSVRRVGS